MKKMTKLMAILLVVVSALSLVACSSKYGALKSTFEKNGYTESQDVESWNKKITAEIKGDEDKDMVTNVHVFYKKTDKDTTIGDLLSRNVILVLEFKATEDMMKFYNESNTAQGAVKDIQKSEDAKAFYNALVEAGYANGNCLVLAIGLDTASVREMVKKA